MFVLISYIVILDPSLVVAAGGVRILTQVLSEGPYELSDTISLAFLYLLDMPASRKYIRPGNDIEVSYISAAFSSLEYRTLMISGVKVVFSVFTDCYSVKVPVPEEKLKSSAKVISCMLKSWPGTQKPKTR